MAEGAQELCQTSVPLNHFPYSPSRRRRDVRLRSQPRKELQPISTMLAVHMIVHRLSIGESFHAHPADVDFTRRASHMVAADCLLDHDAAIGAVLDTEFLLGLTQCLVAS